MHHPRGFASCTRSLINVHLNNILHIRFLRGFLVVVVVVVVVPSHERSRMQRPLVMSIVDSCSCVTNLQAFGDVLGFLNKASFTLSKGIEQVILGGVPWNWCRGDGTYSGIPERCAQSFRTQQL